MEEKKAMKQRAMRESESFEKSAKCKESHIGQSEKIIDGKSESLRVLKLEQMKLKKEKTGGANEKYRIQIEVLSKQQDPKRQLKHSETLKQNRLHCSK